MENTTIFNSKKVSILTLITLTMLSVFLLAKTVTEFIHYNDRDIGNQNNIVVNGEGEQFAVADIASFSFSVIEDGQNVAEAQKKAIEKNNAAIKFIKDQGVEAKDIKTIAYTVEPKYEYTNSTSRFVGYSVIQSVSVKVRNTDKAGEILSGVGSLGVSNISGLSFTIDDESELKDKARVIAIANAREKAEKLADALGVKLDGVIGMYEDNPVSYPYQARTMSLESAGDAKMALPQIELGQNKISVVVNITYRIK